MYRQRYSLLIYSFCILSLIRIQKKIKEENRMKRTKENAGITLIALVITIIVLLILAGISI